MASRNPLSLVCALLPVREALIAFGAKVAVGDEIGLLATLGILATLVGLMVSPNGELVPVLGDVPFFPFGPFDPFDPFGPLFVPFFPLLPLGPLLFGEFESGPPV